MVRGGKKPPDAAACLRCIAIIQPIAPPSERSWPISCSRQLISLIENGFDAHRGWMFTVVAHDPPTQRRRVWTNPTQLH